MSRQSPQAPMSSEIFHDSQQVCAGCHKSVNSETGSVVVAFGSSLWHVDCFRCAKCGDLVNAETPSLLLLTDGSPVCAKCYSCKICNKAILDEAVMAGEDSYHASCFKCRTCHRRIDELVFAKTSQGLYCMNCHNERVARHRKQAAMRKQKEKDRQIQAQEQSSTNSRGSTASGSGHGHSQTNDKRTISGYVTPPPSSSEDHSPSHVHLSRSGSGVSGEGVGLSDNNPIVSMLNGGSATERSPAKDEFTELLNELVNSHTSQSRHTSSSKNHTKDEVKAAMNAETHNYTGSSLDVTDSLYSISVLGEHNSHNHLNDRNLLSNTSLQSSDSEPLDLLPNPHEGDLALIATNSADASSIKSFDTYATMTPHSLRDNTSDGDNLSRKSNVVNEAPIQKAVEFDRTEKRSLDDGVRPLNAFFAKNGNSSTSNSSSSLNVPGGTSRAQKRRSINPGLQLDYSHIRPTSPVSLSRSASSTNAQAKELAVSASSTVSRDSPRTPSPLRDYFIINDRGSPAVEEGDKRSSMMSSGTALYSTSTSPRLIDDGFSRSRAASPINPPSPHSAPPTQQLFSKGVYTMPPQRTDSLGTSPNFEGSNFSILSSNSRHRVDLVPDMLSNNKQVGMNTLIGSPLRSNLHGQSSERPSSRNRSGSELTLDVPHSIESGTDTETEADLDVDKVLEATSLDVSLKGLLSSEVPPAPPPKERTPDQSYYENGDSKESIEDHDLQGNESSEAGSPESSPVQQRRSLFFAHALPPIRFSMDQTDFSEILKKVADSNQVVSPIVEEESPVNSAAKPSETFSNKEEGQSESTEVLVPPLDETLPVTPRPTETSIFSIDINGETPKAAKRSGRRAAPDSLVLSYKDGQSAKLDGPSSPKSADILPELPLKSPRRLSKRFSSNAADSSSPHSRLAFGTRTPTTPLKDNGGHDSPQVFASQQASIFEASIREQRPSKASTKSIGTPSSGKAGNMEFVIRRLKEVYSLSREKKREFIKLEPEFVEAILNAMDDCKEQYLQLSNKNDSMKRASQRMMDGLSVAQEEYDIQVTARREAEAEVTRLKVEIAGQAARITALSSDERRRELQQQMSQELVQNLNGLEKDLSKLKMERDMALAEMEELSVPNSESVGTSVNDAKGQKLSRSLTNRFDNLKMQYQKELLPLTQQREKLIREIAELKQERDIFLDETAVLNKRNEELADLNTQYERRLESSMQDTEEVDGSNDKTETPISNTDSHQIAPPLSTTISTSSSVTLHDEVLDIRPTKVQKPETPDHSAGHGRSRGIGLRWPGNKNKDIGSPSSGPDNKKLKARLQHSFHQMNILRFSRCDHCGEKLFGSQLRCSSCNISIHPRCVHHMQMPCLHDSNTREDTATPGPSLFGRDLTEQVQADSKGDNRMIPVIVEKCIEAVETLGMDYEGIYRKTGGSTQSKLITQLFERGNYDSFDLRDTDFFNDISSVTSVLKTYFRSLPDPLLTYEFHESFVVAAGIRDASKKSSALTELVAKLPQEHYHTLCFLMLHLHRVQLQSDQNLMTARNLGVVFGPTLMRSPDPGREFADMAGKALSIEWLIENAPIVFSNTLADT